MNLSINETSDKIRQRTQELRAEEKSKHEKELQNRKHKLNLERDKRKSITPTLSLIVAIIGLAFAVFAYYKWL